MIDWYLPGRNAGGPVKSVESLVWALKDFFDFRILTTDTDLGASSPYSGIETGKWLQRNDGSQVFYLPKKSITKKMLEEAMNSVSPDVIYLNSLYSRWFSIVPLQLKKRKNRVSKKIVLAPRGMLSEGALALKSFKKKSFIALSKISGLHKNISWQATYPEEQKEIEKHFGNHADIRLCPNFSKPIELSTPNARKKEGELRLFYLSRIARVKNLHIALQALKETKGEGRILFDIFGTPEDAGYVNECKEIASSLPAHIGVSFKGELQNEDLGRVLPAYHFLFLPTSNENFGHSIFESLQCGCPVIISNRTPWRNLEAQGCGWDLEPVPSSYSSLLDRLLSMDDSAYQLLSKAAASFATQKIKAQENIEAAIKLFTF
jgi:glycosyltransferase involved in cell wall biosynthesis